ncbi:MAG: hypothetical protein HOV80_14080 [Polyangiaceae bacterium]|nr:hypothetical protein [Polyangiaceae bacterium]
MRTDSGSLRAFRELARLFTQRLDRTGLGRLARTNAMFIAAASVVWIVYLRAADGPTAPTLAIPVKVARAALWLSAFPLAFAAAHQRRLVDRRDGIEALALARGVDGRQMVSARFAGTLARSVSVIALPAVLAAVVSLACANTMRSAADRMLILAVVSGFGVLAGAVLGALGALSELVAPQRGRSVLLATLFVSWGLADLAEKPFFSITGMLGLVLKGTLRALGLGAVA